MLNEKCVEVFYRRDKYDQSFVAFGLHDLRVLSSISKQLILIWLFHWETGCFHTKTNIKSSSRMLGTTGVIPQAEFKKASTGCWGFFNFNKW